jgi:uncharacterized BrkB/YihY/UPF0761 family membrane protein
MGEFTFILTFVIVGLILLALLDEIKIGSYNDEYRKLIYIITCILGVIFLSMFVIMIYKFFCFL